MDVQEVKLAICILLLFFGNSDVKVLLEGLHLVQDDQLPFKLLSAVSHVEEKNVVEAVQRNGYT